jgi:1-acyl-sn-glycerol-3-phosphate acyltransferase
MSEFLAKTFLKLSGWKIDWNMPKGIDRCVMIAAPHTSNWDIIYTRAAFSLMKIPLRFTIKKEWVDGSLGFLIRAMGGLGIDRSPKNPGDERPSLVEAMAALFDEHEKLAMMVTPEGTRKKVTKWKSGFYWTALEAKVPIAFGYLDYKKKTAGVGGILYPSGDFEKDLMEICAFYAPIAPRFPEKFSVDQRYLDMIQESGKNSESK